VTEVDGVPLIVGGEGGGGVFVVPDVTATAKAGSEALLIPFETEIAILG
jgi:hypothetical protein